MASPALAELLKYLRARKNVPDDVYEAAIAEAEGKKPDTKRMLRMLLDSQHMASKPMAKSK